MLKQWPKEDRNFIRLRRDSDDAERTFYGDEDDNLGMTTAREWADGARLYVVQVHRQFAPFLSEPVLARQRQVL